MKDLALGLTVSLVEILMKELGVMVMMDTKLNKKKGQQKH